MYNPEVYFPLSLSNQKARKLYAIAKRRGCTMVDLIKDIVEDYVNDVQLIGVNLQIPILNKNQVTPRRIIGERISMFRQVNGFTQMELGKAVGLDRRTISGIELGSRRLDVVEAIAIAQVLGVELKEILEVC
ncbi:hypothetical protein ACX27_04275 [Nostoc piscinale CENA21]|uniref:HTH cro/C1-type domain-containing protein n=1 Tax=Nostoc piscinale CENA21 TaxID=224013 RepID=A0A0M4T042_9NOSO|nr:helix-turn-helix transcriptional regulator [Nostoc piscinale]ALF52245.1 hypothetical protein ACX27_04275 [Nostoc piscinale CENA21]